MLWFGWNRPDLSPMSESTRKIEIVRADRDGVRAVGDVVAVEEPLEIRIGTTPISVTMRTPGHDAELAAGFLLTENVIASAADLKEVAHAEEQPRGEAGNVIVATLTGNARADLARLKRNFFATSSCGICGKASLEQVRQFATPYAGTLTVSREVILALPQRMRAAQRAFDETGGLHAAALFDAEGELACLREDVGRHNAVDKVIGWAVLAGRAALDQTVLQVSGRTSFEIVQKALVAGIGVVSAVSAASSLAVELARANKMTLVGFVRDGGFVVYAGADRVIP